MSASFGAYFAWLFGRSLSRTLRLERPTSKSKLPLNSGRAAEFSRYIKSGGLQGLMIAGWAKFAKLDGRVSRQELDVVERWMKAMRFSVDGRKRAIETFTEAKVGRATFWEVALEIHSWDSENNRPLLCIFLFGLMDLAHADNDFADPTEDLLHEVCELFKVPFEKWLSDYRRLSLTEMGIEDLVAGLLGLDPLNAEKAEAPPAQCSAAYSVLAGCGKRRPFERRFLGDQ